MQPDNETYSCSSCTKIFSIKEDLDKHLEMHSLQTEHIPNPHVKLDRVTIFKCDTCTRGFLDQNRLADHANKCLKIEFDSTSEKNNNEFIKSYKCEHCDLAFVKKSTLDTHSIIHKPFPNICECGIGYYKKQDLIGHRRLVHPDLKIITPKITIPKIIYKSDSELEESDKEDVKPRSNVRPRLKAELYYKNNLNSKNEQETQSYKRNKENVAIKQNESGRYICPICSNTFISKTSVNAHINEKHNSEHPYSCIECPKKFYNAGRLAEHKKRHAGIRDYVCSVCYKSFYTKSYLDVHFRTHTGEKPYACRLCPWRFTQSNSLNAHMVVHTGERKYECDSCDKRFPTKCRLEAHVRCHTGEKPYECRRCGKDFSDPSARARHELTHTGRRPHACDLCPAAFCDRSALRMHTLRHAGVTYPCAICGAVYKCRTHMFNHVKLVHTEVNTKKLECDHCGAMFALKSYLARHMKDKHLKYRPRDECQICGAVLAPGGLKNHLLQVHIRKFKHECNICGKHFLFNGMLRKHMERHDKTKDRIFECDHCHKSYAIKQDLFKHIIYKHLGIHCDICSRTFSTNVGLKRHKSKGCIRCPVCYVAFPMKYKMEHHFIVHHVPKSERKYYECEHCGKQFPLKGRLRQHIINIHEEVENSFSCDHCNNTFKHKDQIRDHIWDRHMLSLYCDVCMKRFFNEAEFIQHKRHGCMQKMQLPCEICNKTFPSLNHLRSHRKSHLPKNMECDICGVKYRRKRCLMRHLRSAHN